MRTSQTFSTLFSIIQQVVAELPSLLASPQASAVQLLVPVLAVLLLVQEGPPLVLELVVGREVLPQADLPVDLLYLDPSNITSLFD